MSWAFPPETSGTPNSSTTPPASPPPPNPPPLPALHRHTDRELGKTGLVHLPPLGLSPLPHSPFVSLRALRGQTFRVLFVDRPSMFSQHHPHPNQTHPLQKLKPPIIKIHRQLRRQPPQIQFIRM